MRKSSLFTVPLAIASPLVFLACGSSIDPNVIPPNGDCATCSDPDGAAGPDPQRLENLDSPAHNWTLVNDGGGSATGDAGDASSDDGGEDRDHDPKHGK
jgi:hypothetical protein